MGDIVTDVTTHGFTPNQITWLETRFNRAPSTHVGFDRPTIMWLLGGLAIFGLSVSGVLYSETRSVQEDVNSMQGDIRVMQTDIDGMKTDIRGMKTDIRGMKTDIDGIREEQVALKVQVQANTAALLRIETLLNDLNERLPKD